VSIPFRTVASAGNGYFSKTPIMLLDETGVGAYLVTGTVNSFGGSNKEFFFSHRSREKAFPVGKPVARKNRRARPWHVLCPVLFIWKPNSLFMRFLWAKTTWVH